MFRLVLLRMIFFILLLVSCSLQAQKQYDTLVLHFDFNSYSFRQFDVDRLGDFLRDHLFKPDSLYIIGFTDTVGSVAYNKRLSLLRAQSTAHQVQRFTSTPFSIRAKGEEDPITGDDSLSRRVLVITKNVSHVSGPVRVIDTPRHPGPSASLSPFAPDAPLDQKPDTIISLSNINFIENTPNLTPASVMALPGYIRLLKRYKNEFIEIDGYCNSTTPITSTSDPLFILSVKRAKLVYDFLLDDGFDSTRLSYKGMGNAFPKNASPTTDDEARANMRVEARIYRKE